MSNQKILTIEFLSYFRTGGERTTSSVVDSSCDKQEDFPFFPSKQFKGLLRDAVLKAEAWGWYNGLTINDKKLKKSINNSLTNLIFGLRTETKKTSQNTISEDKSFNGLIDFDDAKLEQELRDYLNHPAEKSKKEYFFQNLYSTALDKNTGSSKDGSLRGEEVALPVTLSCILGVKAAITPIGSKSLDAERQLLFENPDIIWKVIKQALPLIEFMGAKRSRGLGEVIITMDNGG